MTVSALDTRKAKWLEAFDREGTVFTACKESGVARSTVYNWRQQDEAFAIAWHDVEEATTERMEREAFRRSVEGVKRDIYHQGQVVGQERQFSDVLLIFMLKARRPERYRDNVKIEHGGTVNQSHSFDLTRLSAAEKHDLLALVEKVDAAPAEL